MYVLPTISLLQLFMKNEKPIKLKDVWVRDHKTEVYE